MNYDIIITGLAGPRAKNLVARNIASASGASLQDALDHLETLPYVYKRNLTRTQATDLLGRLKQLGALTQVVQNADPDSTDHGHAEHVAPPARPPVAPVAEEAHGGTPTHAAPVRRVLTPIEPLEARPDRRGAYVVLALVAAVVIVAIVLVNNRAAITLDRSGPLPYHPGGQPAAGLSSQQRHPGISPQKTGVRQPVAPEDRKQSQSLVDSAAAAGADLNAAIKFYLMAISINQYNAAAWFGLIGAYTDAGKEKEAAEARRQMIELFGEDALSITGAVKRLGTLRDLSKGDDGTLRVEYQSRLSSRDDLLEESYVLAKELRTLCHCPAISINAGRAGSGGVLVSVATASFPTTLADFRLSASITFLE